MPKQVSAKLGDLLPDNPDRDNPGVARALNVLPHKTSYQPVRDLIAESSPLDGLCRGATATTDKLGIVHNYAGDVTKLYERSGVTWSDVSKAGGYNIPDDHNWSFARFHNISDGSMNMLAANGVDPIQEQISFSGNFDDIAPDVTVPGNENPPGNITPTLRYIAPIRSFLVGGWLAAETSMVKWSGQGNHRVWTPGTTQAGEQVLQRGGQVTGVVGGEYGVIFCEQSIWRMNYVGAPVVFQFDEVSPGHGTTAPGSIAQYGDVVFFIDADGFYVFNGAVATPIGSNKVNDTFLQDYDAEFANRVISAVDIGRSLVWWAYPGLDARSDSSGQKVPNKIMVYDWTSGRFAGPIYLEVEELVYSRTEASFLLDDITVANFPNAATIPGPCYEGGADATCVDLDLFPYQLDAGLFKGGDIQMQAFDFNHRQSTFTGDILKAIIETGEYSLTPGGRAFVTGVRPQVDGDAPTITVRIGERDDTHGPIDWTLEKALHPRTGLANFRANARYHRLEISVEGDFSHIFGADVEFEQAGRQ